MMVLMIMMMTILSSRFDLISQEKEELKEGTEELSSQYKTLEKDIAKLETREKWLQFKVERSNNKAALLKSTLDSLRKHRDSLNDAREIAITEKNEVVKEVVSLGKAHEDLKAKYENDISEHLRMYKELEKKHLDVLEQLNAMELKAGDTQQQLMLAEQTLATMEKECINLVGNIFVNLKNALVILFVIKHPLMIRCIIYISVPLKMSCFYIHAMVNYVFISRI